MRLGCGEGGWGRELERYRAGAWGEAQWGLRKGGKGKEVGEGGSRKTWDGHLIVKS